MADYGPGFVWQRQADWVPGQADGGTENNPGADEMGMPVWGYEHRTGGGLGSENPWYAQPGTMLVWDSQWHISDDGVWARGEDASPPIYQTAILHHNRIEQTDFAPVVRWHNPVGDGAVVDFAGSFVMEWDAGNEKGFPNNTDFVVALSDASAGTVTPLFSETFLKPTQDITEPESIQFNVDLEDIAVDEGDSLLITHQAIVEDPYGWISVFDDFSVTLDVVPTPGAVGLFAVAGLGLIRRRR